MVGLRRVTPHRAASSSMKHERYFPESSRAKLWGFKDSRRQGHLLWAEQGLNQRPAGVRTPDLQ